MSKGQKRKKSKGTQPKKVVVSQNNYTSKCCSAPATKPALTALPNYKDAKLNEFGGLGKFRCSVCKKRCSVNRSKATAQAAVPEEAQ